MAHCALSIQPQQGTSGFYIVLNMSTSDEKGSFNGAVYNAILLPKD
jgi:hypothetical protein